MPYLMIKDLTTSLDLNNWALTRVFVVRMRKFRILDYPKNAPSKDSDQILAKAQADLNLRGAHMSEGTFSDFAASL